MRTRATPDILVGLMILLVLSTPLGAGMIGVSLIATKDATISRDADEDYPGILVRTNIGARSIVAVSTRLSGNHARTLIDFDPSSFEDIGSQNVVSAELHLNIFSGHWPWDRTLKQHIEIRRLTHDWVEGVDGAFPFNSNVDLPVDPPTGVTWLAYDGTNLWPGGPGAKGDTGETVVSGEIPFTPEFRIGKGDERPFSLLPRDRSYDVTELIKEAADPNIPFYGFYFEAIRVGNPQVDPAGEITRWGTKEPGGPAAAFPTDPFPSVLKLVLIPEPTTLSLLAMSVLLVGRRRRT